MTTTARPASTHYAGSTVMTDKTPSRAKGSASRALRIGGRANIAIAAEQAIGLIWAWTMFRAVGIEEDMRELATQGAALPYVLTLVTCAGFLLFGLYALSGAGDLRRLPLLRTALAAIAAIYLFRATLYGGIAALLDGDGPQIAFAAIALIIGLCYAGGAIAYRRLDDGAPNLRVGADPRTSHAAG